MGSIKTRYIRITQQFITPDMFSEDTLGKSTEFLNGWYKSFLGFLDGKGVSMSRHDVDGGFDSAFLKESDVNTSLISTLPVGTYAYGFGRNPVIPFTEDTLPKLYGESQKNFYGHFKLGGFEFASTLSVRPDGVVALALYSVADQVSYSFVFGNVKSSTDIVPKVLTGFFEGFLTRDKKFLETTNYSEAETLGLAKGVKSSLATAVIPTFTKYDIHSLLSDANPSKVWYSPGHRLAVYQCRFGSRLVTFSHTPSGWRISSLRQCWLVRSSGKLLVSRKASFYEEALSTTFSYKTAVMFRSEGQSHFLPLE